MQVLLIEDTRDLGRPLAMLLERSGCEVIWATTGAEALRCVHENPFDIMISDLWLSDTDGISLMPKLLKHCICPAIALSGDFFAGQLDQLKAAGFASFARKPVDVDTLLLLIRRLAGHRAPAYGGSRALTPVIDPASFGQNVAVLA